MLSVNRKNVLNFPLRKMAFLAILVLRSLIPPPGLTRMSRAEGVRWVIAAHRYVADDLSYIVLTRQ